MTSFKFPNSHKHLSSINALPQYEVKNGIRLVKPYFQTIKTTVKSRWLGRTILDILSTEFRSFSKLEYKRRLENDYISVIHRMKLTKKERKELREKAKSVLGNHESSGCADINTRRIQYPEIMDYKMNDNDIIERLEHIHERSVIGTDPADIEVIFEDDATLVVNKPSGIPIHPVQNYFYNSLVQVLQFEGWKGRCPDKPAFQLRPCHRLDKLTSGVCIFAKTQASARQIQLDIQNRNVEKVYLARVKGKFPGEGKDVECLDEVIVLDTKKGKTDGVLKKDAKTIFKLIRYSNELDESIVMCWPKTGRTHQIRIHLRNLGHPIVNDPLYGTEGLMSLAKVQNHETENDYFESIKGQAELNRSEAESDEKCDECGMKLYLQHEPSKLVLYLHAFSYCLNEENGWKYQTEWPQWTEI